VGMMIDFETGASSLEGLFAAGDVSNIATKQIIVAAGAGCRAALGAYNHINKK